MKRLIALIASMRFAIALLIAIIIFSLAGAVIPQHEPDAFYLSRYPFLAPLIFIFSLDAIYEAPLYITLFALLGVSVIVCIGRNVLSLRKRKRLLQNRVWWQERGGGAYTLTDANASISLLRTRGYRATRTHEGMLLEKNRFHVWGAVVTHAAFLVILAGALLSTRAYEGTLPLAKGEPLTTLYDDDGGVVKRLPYAVTLTDFTVVSNAKEGVRDYQSDIRITHDGQTTNARIAMNRPFTYEGDRMFQMDFTTVYTARVTLRTGARTPKDYTLYTGEQAPLRDIPYALALSLFYADFTFTNGRAWSTSDVTNNPVIAFTLLAHGVRPYARFFYHVRRGTYTTRYTNELAHFKRYFSVRDVAIKATVVSYVFLRNDPGGGIAIAGGILLFAGLLITFFFRRRTCFIANAKETATLYTLAEEGDAHERDIALVTDDARTKGEST